MKESSTRSRGNACVKALFPAVFCVWAGLSQAAYFPNMVYGPKNQVAPGVTWQTATHSSPAQRIRIIEIDMTNRNVELMPVFKARGNVSGATNERTSSMAMRTNAVAAINAGYYNTTNLMTNSYTEIDGVFIGGAGTAMTPENNRSVLGFSGDHQTIAKRTKLSNAFVPADPTNWDKIVDAIAGRGHFVTSGGTVVTVDNEGTTTDHNATVQPRTVIGYTASPYKVFLVTVDGRQTGTADGMTYAQLAQLMADLGCEQSISLDGGGSTTAWIKGTGIINVPSDGSERAVASAWVVITGMTMDNTVDEVSVSGTWTTDSSNASRYYLDQLVTDHTVGAALVTWTPNLELAGLYRVYAWWTSEAGRNTAAAYEITHAAGTATVAVNQAVEGGKWNVLGAYNFNAGTAGKVVLRNTGTGSVSADAVRFVRISDIPAPIDPLYTVTGTVFATDFETDASASFATSQQAAGDNSINFTYDYSTYAQQGGNRPTSIPLSPGSTGSGTKALRVATNLASAAVNGITTTLTGISGMNNVRITFDAWINYNGGSGGGSGSTEFMTFGASANPSLVAMSGSDYTSSSGNQPFSGFFFALAGEGGAAQDYRYYDGNGTGAVTGNNGARANFLGTAAVDNAAFTNVFAPIQLFETPGCPGKAWIQWEIVVLNGKVRLLMTKPDGHKMILCDWFTPNTVATLTGLLPHLGTMDVYSSLANPASDNFVLYDNLKVESIAPAAPLGIEQWMMYQ